MEKEVYGEKMKAGREVSKGKGSRGEEWRWKEGRKER